MGSEDLHHRRKKRKIESLKRVSLGRESYDVVLIVCEGAKTEPGYLNDLKDELKLSNANIKVIGHGTDPLTLVEFAIEEYNKYREYDKIYCVFDQDEHKSYHFALDEINRFNSKGIPIFSITSVPCFEFFLLSHYVYSTRSYKRSGKKSAGEQLCSELKRYIPNYKKGYPNIYDVTKSKLPTAIKNVKKIEKEQSINGHNPSTNFYQLVEYLQELKSKFNLISKEHSSARD